MSDMLPISTETGVLIGSMSCFLTNLALICGTMIPAFVSDAMPVNATFRSALSNATVDEHPELWSGAYHGSQHIMDDFNCYELWVIGTAICTSVKFYSPKLFPSFKACQALYFNRTMPVLIVIRLFNPYLQRSRYSFFLCLRISRICPQLSMCGIPLVGVSLVIFVLLLLKTNF